MMRPVMNNRGWLRRGLVLKLLLLTACASQPRVTPTEPATIADLSTLAPTAAHPEAGYSAPSNPAASNPAALALNPAALNPAASSTVTASSAVSQDGREKAIQAYRDYLVAYPQSSASRDIRRRLADLLVESAAAAADGAEDDAGAEGAVAISGRADQLERYDQAIALYAELLATDAGDESTAELLYQLAKAQELRGRPAQALRTVRQLIASYSGVNRKLIADAQFRHGELLFGQQDFVEAEQAYAAVVRLGDSVAVYEQALSQLGWSLFRQGRYQAALQPYFALLDRKIPADMAAESAVSRLSRAEQEQLDDLYRAISLCFSYLAGPQSIAAFFEAQGWRSYQVQVYQSLADLYERKGLFVDAAQTWIALALRDAEAAEAPRYYLRAMRLYQQNGATQSTLETRQAFVERYRIGAEFWHKHPPSAFSDVIQQLQASLVELAGFYHRQALKTGTDIAFGQAESWYREYLTSFADSPEAAEMRFQLAELLYQRGHYAAAAEEYEHTAYRLDAHPRGGEAGRSALRALEQLQADTTVAPVGADGPVGANDKAAAAGAASERLMQSRRRFVQTYPRHGDAAAVLGQLATELLATGQPAEAAGLAESLLQQAEPLPAALRQSAWTVFGQASFQLQDYQQAERGYRQALGLVEATDPRLQALQQGLAIALYRQAGAALERGRQRQAADLYLQAIANSETESALHAEAQVDAAAALLGLQQWRPAIAVLEQFRGDHPRHPRLPDVTHKLAFAYERSERPLAAAREYLRLGQGEGEVALRREAIMRAAELFQQSAQPQQATTALELYLQRFPSPVLPAMVARQQLAELAKARGDENGQRRWLRDIVRTDQVQGDPSTRLLAAQAALSLAEQPRRRFEQIQLVEPLQQNLGDKLAAMKRALQALESVTEYGIDEVTSAATYRIAAMYQDLSRELLQSQRPQGLDGEQLAQYDLLLEEQAAPFEEQAIELYQANIDRISNGQYDVWIERSLRRLAELWPVRYGKVERGELAVEIVD